MAIRKANEARFLVDLPAIGSPMIVRRFQGRERISNLFEFKISVLSEDPAIPCGDAINQAISLTLIEYDLSETQIHGIVSNMRQRGKIAEWIEYEITMVPALWRLGLSYQSRVFQNMTADAIVSQVLGENGVKFEFRLGGALPNREYTTQFRETDLAFVSRLLEFEGIHYYFTHDGGSDMLVMADDASANGPIEGTSTLDYHPDSGLVDIDDPLAEMVMDFSLVTRAVTGKVILNDYNYRDPETKLVVDSQMNPDMPGTYYEYGEHYKTPGEGQRLVKIRNEEIESLRETMEGKSNCQRLRAGLHWTLEDHFRDDLNAEFMVVEVRHAGQQDAAVMDVVAGEYSYVNEFVSIRASVPFRPARDTPEPILPGLMTARVDSAGGDYAYLDEDGRYRVKMPFDLSDMNGGTATKPIRLAQPYSGSDYGMHFPIHKGADMVWACVNGNLDRPLAIGTAPHPNTGSPANAQNRPQNVIRTWGQNELTMDDTMGAENIFMNATKDHNKQIANDQNNTVGNNQTNNVGVNLDEVVGTDRSREVGNNEQVSIGVNQSLTVGTAQDETIGVSRVTNIGTSDAESVGVTKSLQVGTTMSENIGSVKMTTAGMMLNQNAGVAHVSNAGAIMSHVSGGMLFQGAPFITAKAGTNGDLSAGTDMTVSAGAKLTLMCGDAVLVMKQDGTVTLNGKSLTTEMSADTTMVAGGDTNIRASKTALNS